jgi:hypothetical protein
MKSARKVTTQIVNFLPQNSYRQHLHAPLPKSGGCNRLRRSAFQVVFEILNKEMIKNLDG